MRVVHARFLSDTTHRPMLMSESVCRAKLSRSGEGPQQERKPDIGKGSTDLGPSLSHSALYFWCESNSRVKKCLVGSV